MTHVKRFLCFNLEMHFVRNQHPLHQELFLMRVFFSRVQKVPNNYVGSVCNCGAGCQKKKEKRHSSLRFAPRPLALDTLVESNRKKREGVMKYIWSRGRKKAVENTHPHSGKSEEHVYPSTCERVEGAPTVCVLRTRVTYNERTLEEIYPPNLSKLIYGLSLFETRHM
jgi:hypothetical protein